MDDFLPILVFIILVVAGNVLDKKKPTAKPVPPEFPKPTDIEPVPPNHRPHHPEEYAVVHNPYQEYLTRHVTSTENQNESVPSPYNEMKSKRELSPLAKAVIWSEILGKPKSLRD